MSPRTKLAALILFAVAVLLLPLPHPQQRLLATSCTTDSQRSAPDGACDKTTSTCVQCVANGHSALSQSDCCSDYLDPSTNLCANGQSCAGCSSDGACANCSAGNACDLSDGDCVSCVGAGNAAQSASDCCSGNLYQGECVDCDLCSDDSGCSKCQDFCDLTVRSCTSCVPSGDYADEQSDCCTGTGSYDNAQYQCE